MVTPKYRLTYKDFPEISFPKRWNDHYITDEQIITKKLLERQTNFQDERKMNKRSKYRVEGTNKYDLNYVKIGTYSFDEAELPETLYKYRDWTNHWHRTILTDRTVFMAAPSSFEDPLDCKNPIRWDLLRRKDIFFKYYFEIKKSKPDWPKKCMKSWTKMWLKKSPLRDKNFIKEQTAQTAKDFDCRFGVLSLTANCQNAKMWQYYANNDTGFCVGFHPRILFNFLGGGGEVHYDEELPIIYPTPRHSYELQHILQVFYKEKKWEYEQEYRTHKFSPFPMTDKDRQIILPPEAYKEIIIGSRMDINVKNDLIKSIPKELHHINIRD